jgi:hypothetical protein
VFDLIGEIEEIREDPDIKTPIIADMLYKRRISRSGDGMAVRNRRIAIYQRLQCRYIMDELP